MTLHEYKASLKAQLKPRTVTFLIKNNKVLLGFKKTGFGHGYYIGIGGKVEGDETIEQAAQRELSEEIGVENTELAPHGVVNFYFPKESWNQAVHIFTADSWTGDPRESQEIRPEWFDKDGLPIDQMWDDARYWIPRVVIGEKVKADFLFNDELKVIETTA